MVTAMQAVYCVSWEPLSGQDMRLVWRQRSMRNHNEVSTSLFRKSLCVRMRISSLMNNHGTRKSDAFRRAVVIWSDYIRDMGYRITGLNAVLLPGAFPRLFPIVGGLFPGRGGILTFKPTQP